jgi:uncharacterized damage-inducible protein DinB
MNDDLRLLYDMTRRTRANVLDWLETLPVEVFTLEREDFAYGSLRNIYAHIAGCYQWWIGTVGLEFKKQDEPTVTNVAELRIAFDRVDDLMQEALETFSDLDTKFEWTSPSGVKEMLSKRWLMLHPITHEFHHKGQALALARVIGHPHPGRPDTDLVTP